MSAGITRVDHPVIAVADMDASHGVYEKLGFNIPPLGTHLEWGTGNWCIMFADDYLELRGIADASRYTHHLDKFLAARGEGLMGVAFGTRDARESFEGAKQAGLEPIEVKELTRRFALPAGDAFPKFRIVYLSENDAPGLLTTVICGHLTPEIIRSPEWLVHPNRVTGVLSMTSVVEDPQAHADTYRKLVGPDAVSPIDGGIRVPPQAGAFIDFLTPAKAAERGLIAKGAALPAIPALALAVDDIAGTRALLQRNGVPFADAGHGIRVEPEHTCGVVMVFEERRHV